MVRIQFEGNHAPIKQYKRDQVHFLVNTGSRIIENKLRRKFFPIANRCGGSNPAGTYLYRFPNPEGQGNIYLT